ncbi:MAG: SUMF1/EgtB/PvdO family nonheme iron enzyme [Planctomycetes bacterium]|nr:SUMF1/EgtB/PvdO family nonheme iron enzyme [Planctomycetota bacterium]
MPDPRRLTPDQLCAALAAVRATTLARSLDLNDEQWAVPFDPYNQPTAWDLGHIGWFAEFWLLRGPHRLRPDGHIAPHSAGRHFPQDAWYDSAVVAHPDRWQAPPHGRPQLLELLERQLAGAQQHVRAHADPDTTYFAHLALLHECMHAEALAWTRATCGYPAPADVAMPEVPVAEQVRIASGIHRIGAEPDAGFAFDNERPPVGVQLDAFSIDSHVVRNDAFVAFVDDGGYRRDELWPDGRPARELPARWRRAADGSIEHRHYDRWLPLPLAQPVVHVDAFEAEAFCRWAGRRLPTAAEWEVAAAQGIAWGGTVWEWTASTFAPYGDGFRPGPYVTYSTPWFHHQRELRGGAYPTDPRMHDRRYRNFFLPRRSDVFAGFRTASGA